ncbi:Inosine-uridine preferring nucleoside hydrolase [Arthrobacter sp. 9V]|uniref:nucleoside hydrolase n=1 Tax=Arthrobacter sp. 9V TaxID=2653132 RepID=UPI0012F4537B|nr:nucleoside hydrolase [Arthrobacter sp. 9V]VXB42807.1 Inosine-uridine preferring nucleoside hydrolase [Arthrobacter sp. 9V]
MSMISIAAKSRVVLDNDWAGDPDGLVGLAHHAMAPANRIVAITSSLTNPMFGPPAGKAQAGAELALELMDILDRRGHATVQAGPDSAFTGRIRKNPAAQAIIEAVRDEGELPLTLVCAGPLTNVADALLEEPGIASRFKLAWVGGSSKGLDHDEYNYFTDPMAAQFVFANQQLEIDQFPLEAYQQVVISVAELDEALKGGSRVGRWLWDHFHGLEVPDFIKFGPLWCLGDSAPLVVTGLEEVTSRFDTTSASPRRRMCQHVDARLIVADFLASLRLHAQRHSATTAG